MKPDLCFILYDSRSGSTYLAKRLAQFEEVGVSVESLLVRRLLLLGQKRLARVQRAAELHWLIHEEERVVNLGLEIADLEGGFDQALPLDVEKAVRLCYTAYFARIKPKARVWVIKDGSVGLYLDEMRLRLPEARFIHIIRDGRAVLNSKLKTERPYAPSRKMTSGAVSAARAWKRQLSRVDAFATRNPHAVFTLRYEDLITGEEKELSRLAEFLGLAGGARTPDVAYVEHIPVAERKIHALVGQGAASVRIAAWEEELDPEQRLAFEMSARRALAAHGYEVNSLWREIRLRGPLRLLAILGHAWAVKVREWAGVLADRTALRRYAQSYRLYLINFARRVGRG